MGAVMGSKSLKGIAVVGNKNPIPVHDPVSLAKALKEYMPILKKHTALHTLYGTGRLVMPKEATGGLPLRNFSPAYPWSEGAQKISGQTIAKTIRQKDYACYYCPIKCGKEVMISSGPYARMVSRGPEYETLAGFGSNLLNDNLENIVTANYLCNEYGLDTISTSVTLAFAFECFERGLISKRDCDGLELKWGNTEAILEMVRKIGEREGLGDILAEGSRMAAQKIGGSSGEIIAHAKGLEPSTTMPTPTVSLALSWATSNRGACHLEGFSHLVEGGVPVSDLGFESMDGYTNYGKGRLVKIMQNLMAVYNNLGICKMLFSGRLGPERMSQWVHHVTGWDMDKEKLMELGDRTYNWKRAFNIQCGISRTDDQISPKLLGGLRQEGSLEEKRIFFEGMLKDYYRERGWDEKGIPSSEILQKYGIRW
jgi:aldehyde:ferredoxin oxidoreductase